jgi:hypothetical protein
MHQNSVITVFDDIHPLCYVALMFTEEIIYLPSVDKTTYCESIDAIYEIKGDYAKINLN